MTLDDGLIVAAPMRMLFGLAAVFNQFRFERAAEDAWHHKLITPDFAANYLQQHRRRGKDGVARGFLGGGAGFGVGGAVVGMGR